MSVIEIAIGPWDVSDYPLSARLIQGETTLGPYELTEGPTGVFSGTVADEIDGLYDIEVTQLGKVIWFAYASQGHVQYGPLPDPADVAVGYVYGPTDAPLTGTNTQIATSTDDPVFVYGQRFPALSAFAAGATVPGVGLGTGVVEAKQKPRKSRNIFEDGCLNLYKDNDYLIANRNEICTSLEFARGIDTAEEAFLTTRHRKTKVVEIERLAATSIDREAETATFEISSGNLDYEHGAYYEYLIELKHGESHQVVAAGHHVLHDGFSSVPV